MAVKRKPKPKPPPNKPEAPRGMRGVNRNTNDRGPAWKWMVIKPDGTVVTGGQDTKEWAITEADQVLEEARASAGVDVE